MKKFNAFSSGGSSLQNGFLALTFILLVALGCTCTGKDGFQFGKDSNSSEKPSKDLDSDSPADDNEKVEKLSADEIPSEKKLQDLAKTTLLKFNDAVQDGDFSDFHKTISKRWRSSSRPKQFEDGFRQFIDKKVNIDVIRSKEAIFSPKPKIDDSANNRPTLLLKGRYDTSPRNVNFELDYIFEDDDWRLSQIKVDTR